MKDFFVHYIVSDIKVQVVFVMNEDFQSSFYLSFNDIKQMNENIVEDENVDIPNIFSL